VSYAGYNSSCNQQANPEWVGTTLVFDLEDKGDKTILRFAHKNWKETTDFYANYES